MPELIIDESEVIRLYTQEQWNILQIASHFNVNHGTIRLRLTRNGIPLRKFSDIQKQTMNRPEVKERTSQASKRSNSKRIKTNIERYGTAVPASGVPWKDKYEEKYGVRHPNQRPEILEKTKQTNLNKYGVENVSHVDEFREKIKQNRWENKSEDELKDIREKTEQTWMNKYGVSNPMQNEVVQGRMGLTRRSKSDEEKDKIQGKINTTRIKNSINGIIIKLNALNLELLDGFTTTTSYNKFKCRRCRSIFTSKIDYIFQDYGLCPKCYPKIMSRLFGYEINLYIRELLNGGDDIVLSNNRTLLLVEGMELDTYVPTRNIAFEYNGLFWHSEGRVHNRYHIEKTIKCENHGVQLIHIFEDEWAFKPNIVKARIRNILGLNNATVIYARECIIKEVESSIKDNFLDEYHIQGRDRSAIHLGAYHDEILVAVMTFSKGNISKGSRPVDGIYELNRFCSNYNYRVVGIAGKLLSHFKNNYEWKEIFSYADRRWSDGNLYKKLGFNLCGETLPNYWYAKGLKRIHRFNLRKREDEPREVSEWILRQNEGYRRIWDCGNLKFNILNEYLTKE